MMTFVEVNCLEDEFQKLAQTLNKIDEEYLGFFEGKSLRRAGGPGTGLVKA